MKTRSEPPPPQKPGAFLKALIRAQTPRITQGDLADALQVTRLTVNMVLNGKSAVTTEMALRLERVLGTSPVMLLGMQIEHDLFNTRRKMAGTLSRIEPLARTD